MEIIPGETMLIEQLEPGDVCEAIDITTNDRLFLLKNSADEMIDMDSGLITPIDPSQEVNKLHNAVFLPFGL